MSESKILTIESKKKDTGYEFRDESVEVAVDDFFLHKYGVSYYTYSKSMLEEVTELEILKADDISELSRMPYIAKLTLEGGGFLDLRVLENLPLLRELHLIDVTGRPHEGYLKLNKLNTLSVKGTFSLHMDEIRRFPKLRHLKLSDYGNADLYGIQYMPCLRSFELTDTNLTDVFNLCMCRRPIRFKASADVMWKLYSARRTKELLSIIADNISKLEPGARPKRKDDDGTIEGKKTPVFNSESMTKDAFVAMKAVLLLLQSMDDSENGITELINNAYYSELEEEDMPF